MRPSTRSGRVTLVVWLLVAPACDDDSTLHGGSNQDVPGDVAGEGAADTGGDADASPGDVGSDAADSASDGDGVAEDPTAVDAADGGDPTDMPAEDLAVDPPGDDGSAGDPADDADGSNDGSDGGEPEDPVAAVDPGPPDFPDVVGVLSIAVLTGLGANDGTDANELSVCLSDTDCFPINVADVDDYRVGELDVYHLEGVDLPRADVDQVTIVSANGTDWWHPTCLEVQFDGEPVHCEDALPSAGFGSDAGELASWTDPNGLHLGCNTCYPDPLTHGPMIGAVEPDTLRVLARTDATRQVGLRLSHSPTLADGVVVDWAYPSPLNDYTVDLEVTGLQPATTYFYGVEVDGELLSGPSVAVSTAPEVGASGRFALAFGSCTILDDQPIFATVAELDPNLFLFIGDNHYGNTNVVDALRWNYRWALERPERAALLAATPTLATWDDHDYVGNNTTGSAPGKANALRVFQEYWANPSYGLAETPGVFFRWAYGDVDFFFLDDRYYRGLDDSVLGDEQTDWLMDELAASTATFKLLLSGSQWTASGSSDSWAAYLPARDALFDFIAAEGIEGVVLLSGDVHRSELRSIPRDSGYDLPELVSSPLGNTNFGCQPDPEGSLITCVADSRFFIHVDIDSSLADPLLDVTLYDEEGDIRATWAIRGSDLQ